VGGGGGKIWRRQACRQGAMRRARGTGGNPWYEKLMQFFTIRRPRGPGRIKKPQSRTGTAVGAKVLGSRPYFWVSAASSAVSIGFSETTSKVSSTVTSWWSLIFTSCLPRVLTGV